MNWLCYRKKATLLVKKVRKLKIDVLEFILFSAVVKRNNVYLNFDRKYSNERVSHQARPKALFSTARDDSSPLTQLETAEPILQGSTMSKNGSFFDSFLGLLCIRR